MKKENLVSKSVILDDLSSMQFANTDNLKAGCRNILRRLFDDKRSEQFRLPVDYEYHGLVDYPVLIKTPMDLSTVRTKLNKDKYASLKDFSDDIQLIWDNCTTYNQDGSQIYNDALHLQQKSQKLIEEFTQKFKKTKSPSFSNPPTLSKSSFSSPKTHSIEENKKSLSDFKQNNIAYPNINSSVSEYEPKATSQLSLKDKIFLSEKFKNLDSDVICKIVSMIYTAMPTALEEVGDEKLQIRVDLLDKSLYDKIVE